MVQLHTEILLQCSSFNASNCFDLAVTMYDLDTLRNLCWKGGKKTSTKSQHAINILVSEAIVV